MSSAKKNIHSRLFISQVILFSLLISKSYCETISNELAVSLIKSEAKAYKTKKTNRAKIHKQSKDTQIYPQNYWDPPGRYDGGSEPDPI